MQNAGNQPNNGGRGAGRGQAPRGGQGGRGNGARGQFVPRGGQPAAGGRGQGPPRGGRGRGAPARGPVQGGPPAPNGNPVVGAAVLLHANGIAQAPAPNGPRLTVAQVMDHAVRGYVVRAHADDADAIRAAFSVDVHTMATGAAGRNPHAVLAAGRAMVTVWCLARLISDGHRFIDCRYGNWRDLGAATYLNACLAREGYGSALVPYVSVALLDSWITPADAHRRPFHAPHASRATAAFYMDVYYHGFDGDEPRPCSPGALAAHGYDHIIWAGHAFRDIFGSIGGAVWCRDGKNVTWFPDPVNPPYPEHDACDSMHVDGSIAGWVWSVVKTWTLNEKNECGHLYDALEIRLVPTGVALPVRAGVVAPGDHMVLTLNVPDVEKVIQSGTGFYLDFLVREVVHWWAIYVDSGLPRKEVYVKRSHLKMAQDFISDRRKTPLCYNSLKKEINRFLSLDDAFGAVSGRFPLKFMHYRRDLALAAMTFGVEGDASMALAMRASNAEHFRRYNESEAGMDIPMAANGWKWWRVLFVGLVAAYAVYHWRSSVPMAADLGVYHPGRVRAKVHSYVDKAMNAVSSVKKVTDVDFRAVAHSVIDQGANAIVGVGNQVAAFAQHVYHGLLSKETLTAATNINPTEVVGDVVQQLNMGRGPRRIRHGEDDGFTRHVRLVLVQPIVEELLKRMVGPMGSCVISAFIAVGDLAPYSSSFSVGGLARALVARFIAHQALACLPLWLAVVLHSGHNASVLRNWAQGHTTTGTTRTVLDLVPMASSLGTWLGALWALFSRLWCAETPVEKFDNHYYRDSLPFVFDDTVAISRLGSNVFVPACTAHPTTTPDRDPTVRLSGPLVFANDGYTDRRGYHRTIGHNAPMYKPDNSPLNTQHLVTHRLARAIPHRSTRGRWMKVFKRLAFRQGLAIRRADFYAMLVGANTKHNVQPDWLPTVQPGDIDFDHRFDLVNAPAWRNPWPVPDLPMVGTEEAVAHWLAHTDPAKRKRYIAALDANLQTDVNEHSKVTRGVQINIKCDEVLLKFGWVPRPIHAVDPRLAVRLGPSVYMASERIKAYMWNAPVAAYRFDGIPYIVGFTYGAGRTAAQLAAWFQHAIDVIGIHIIAAGDDSVVVFNDGRGLVFFEGDISQNDHSVREPALLFEWAVLKAAGVQQDILSMLAVNARAPCVVACRQTDGGSVTLFREAERNTGGVDTTIGNTLVTMGGWLASIHDCARRGVHINDRMVIDGFAKCGLQLKMRSVRGSVAALGMTYYAPSFLKGTWYAVEDPAGCTVEIGDCSVMCHFMWAPLLGRLLKVTKTMSDPRVTQRFVSEPRNQLGLHEALCRQHVSVAKSLLAFSLPEPIKMWLEEALVAYPLAADVRASSEDVAESWRPKGDAAPRILDPTAQIADWYETDHDMVRSFLAHVCLLSVGDFSQHPMWAIMAIRDYN